MPSSAALGVLLALASAAVWGGGDFSGGLAARRHHQVQVLVLSAFSGLVMVLLCAVLWREPMPSARSVGWAALGGASAAVGIAALYHGLSLGHAATVAPTSAVVGASVPVLFAAIVHGAPRLLHVTGFALAGIGIWLVGGGASASLRHGLFSALVAGLGFGGFFVFMGQLDHPGVFAPLVVARGIGVGGGLILLAAKRLSVPPPGANWFGVLAGILDAGGNTLYLLAQQLIRLDVAAVLSSFYPVTTVLLARVVLRERVTGRQWLGAAICAAATLLITA